jgi:hypothetical protein
MALLLPSMRYLILSGCGLHAHVAAPGSHVVCASKPACCPAFLPGTAANPDAGAEYNMTADWPGIYFTCTRCCTAPCCPALSARRYQVLPVTITTFVPSDPFPIHKHRNKYTAPVTTNLPRTVQLCRMQARSYLVCCIQWNYRQGHVAAPHHSRAGGIPVYIPLQDSTVVGSGSG